ncbi:proprotein convertase subtilisin/kexin type 5-like [Anneissia japonica]|uniref:proprotein convertase subtilisin/kexin type 5-like n=1 Tax=Anneissia japonica TaxID=1529436 RepID=UPI0014256ACD|nr:proprotein convertase subtilisin/kexin type 5-like [Anneissia japonica]
MFIVHNNFCVMQFILKFKGLLLQVLLTLVLLFLSEAVGDIYSNQFAIHVYGGEQVATSLAFKYGFRYHGQISKLEDHYLLSHQEVSKRSNKVSDGKHMLLAQEPQVIFFEQQKILYRSNHDINVKNFIMSEEWYPTPGHHVYEAWKNGFTGKGVVLSVLDDGIEWTHPDLKDNYEPMASYDYNDNDPNPIPRYDSLNKNNHGTRCAGVVSMGNNTICGIGVAYEAKIGGIRMLDGDVTDAIEAAALSHNPQVIDVYSSSWGPKDDGRTVDGPGLLAKTALERAATKGRDGKGSIHVWGSGNGGPYKDDCNCDGYTNSIYTLSVTGVSEGSKKSWYTEECSSIFATTYSSGDVTQRQVTTDLRGECTDRHTGTSASAAMAAAICALALQANPDLSWRDMQYIVAVTSRHESLQDADWNKNGAGYFVSNRYGFGMMDANQMTQLAKVWKPLPKQNICEIKGEIQKGTLSSGQRLKLHLTTDGQCGNQVKYLEHVQVRITLDYSARGNLFISLTSPSGTRSRLLSGRPNDVDAGEFDDWPFMTTHSWGELSNGTWTLEIDDPIADSHHSGELYSWYLVLYGTVAPPSLRASNINQGVDVLGRKVREVKTDDSFDDYYSSYEYLANCHEQCYPPAGCSGEKPEDCFKCKNYRDRDTEKCVKECPDGQFPPPESHQRCRYCSSHCKTCYGHGANNCLSCNDDLYLREDTARCVPACDNGLYADESRVCKVCDLTCYTCANSTTFCTSCPIGLYLNSLNRCVTECDDNEYLHYISDDGQCLECDVACTTCNGPGPTQCLSCKPGYVKKDGVCIEYRSCPSGYYIDDDNCLRCHPACSECIGPEDQDCTQCPDHYVLVGKRCQQSCGDKQYVNEEGNCDDCLSGCKTCVTSNSCIECLDHWVLINGRCQDGCPLNMYELDYVCYSCHSTCSQCTGGDPHDCIKCKTVQRYLFNHRCLLACPNGYFEDDNHISGLQCSKCDETCASCHGPSFKDCDTCMDGLVKDTDSSRCTEGSFTCSTSCITCSDGWLCTACDNTTFLYNRDCVEQCPPNFVALTDIGICGACHPSCDTCDDISHHNCVTCIPSYFKTPDGTCEPDCIWFDGTYPNLDTMECSACDSSCDQCLGPAADECVVCADGQYLKALEDASGAVKHKCVEASECGHDSYADEVINECIPCYPTCHNCTGPGVLDCIQCKENFTRDLYGICRSICNSGQYPTSTGCKDCHDSCLSCQGDRDSDCLTCEVTKFWMPTGECAPHCADTYYPDFQDNICKSCYPTCQTCVSYEDSECLTCKSGYYLHMARYCKAQCPEGYYEYDNKVEPRKCRQCSVECTDCTGNYLNCTKCYAGEFLHQGRCLDQCPVGYEGVSGDCVVQGHIEGYRCPPLCQECSNNLCTKCNDGYTLYYGGCLSNNCDAKKYFNGTDCKDCDVTCETCLGPSNADCLTCLSGNLLKNGLCVSNCPEGSYKVESSDECGECHPTCRNCDGPSQYDCLKCQNDMYMSFDNSCHNECPPGFYYDSESDCQPCDKTCRTCNGPSAQECIGCPRNTYLHNSVCLHSCPIERGYYHFLVDEFEYASSTNECRRCSNNCQMCYGGKEDECTSCKELLFLKGNECLINCGLSFYEDLHSNTCKHCHKSCESCSGSTDVDCLTCSTNKFLMEGKCYDTRPPHTYCINTAYSKECRPCHASCLTCSLGGGVFDCESCHPGHIMDNGVCYPRCETGTYFKNMSSDASIEDSCGKCLSPCHDCYGNRSNECITCVKDKKIHHVDKNHHYCVRCCEDGEKLVEGTCCECNKKTDRCRPGLGKEDDIYKGANNKNRETEGSPVTAIVLSCLGVILLFFVIFGLLQARSNRNCCFAPSYERLPTYYNGSNVQVVLAKEPPMPNRHEYMSPDEEETDEYPSDDDDDDAEEIY